MEHSIETLPEWKPYLAQLKQICKMLGDPLIKEVLLEKAFGTASTYERKQIHRFNLKIVDWRWEYLEDIVVRLLEIIPWLSQRKALLPGIFLNTTLKFSDDNFSSVNVYYVISTYLHIHVDTRYMSLLLKIN